MKIYEIGTGYTPIPAQMGAATEIVVEELTRSFVKNGENVEIIDIGTISRKPTELPITEVKVPKVFSSTDVSLGIMHKLKRVVYSVCLANRLKKILKHSTEKTVLHFHNQYNLFFAMKLIGRKLLSKAVLAYTVHSYIWHGAWESIENDIKNRYFQEVFCIENADIVFVLNDTTKNNIIEHTSVKAERVIQIENGVNLDTYKPLSADMKESAKARFGVSGKRVFVQVGSVCDRKNQLESVRLLLSLLAEDKECVFCYAGGVISEEYRTMLTEYADQNGIGDRVIYAGELSPGAELNEFYNMADAMIFPSKAEGFSLVIIEAMSAGVPVVVNSDLRFDLSEECLRYTDEEDFLHLLKTKVLDETAGAELSRRVRETVADRYGWHVVAEKYKAAFLVADQTK